MASALTRSRATEIGSDAASQALHHRHRLDERGDALGDRTVTANGHAARLTDLFSRAGLAVHVPSAQPSAADRDQGGQRITRDYGSSRQTAYYDESLQATVTLSLPASPLLAPPPNALPLPLPIAPPMPHASAHAVDPHAGNDADAVPPLLSTLLFCLHVSLKAEYLPHAQPHTPLQPWQHDPLEPLPTVRRAHASYQLPTLSSAAEAGNGAATLPTIQHSHQPHQPGHQSPQQPVGCFAAVWAGNKGPEPPTDRRSSSPSSSSSSPQPPAAEAEPRGAISYHGDHWSVEWHCDVPVTFVTTPFVPLLALTASLTLRLAPPLLDSLLSHPTDVDGLASAFSHSLLAPLHEGPVYPDESTSERMVRVRNSSALGLDGPKGLGSHLAQLGKEVLGGNHALVTPRSGLEGLRDIERRKKKLLATAMATAAATGLAPPDSRAAMPGMVDDDGDLGGTSRSKSGSDDDGDDAELPGSVRSEAPNLQILKRSSRLVMDVKSGLGVRMRTLFTPYSPFSLRSSGPSRVRSDNDGGDGARDDDDDDEEDEDRDDGERLDQASLVLCVELENTPQSGLEFQVDRIEVRVEQAHPLSGEPRAVVRLLDGAMAIRPEDSAGSYPFPIRLEQGQQRNMLYYLSIEHDALSHGAGTGTAGVGELADARARSGKRNVAIVVSGRPILLSSTEGAAETAATEPFDSKWNCILDLSPLFNNARRRANASQPLADPSSLPAPFSSRGPQSRPATQLFPPTAGSVRHSAMALEQAYQADRARNLEKLAQAGSIGGGTNASRALTYPNAPPWAAAAAMGSSTGRSLSFGPATVGSRAVSNDSTLALSGSLGTLPQARLHQQQQQIGRGLPAPLALSGSGPARRTPSAIATGEMTPNGERIMSPYGAPSLTSTPRTASFRLASTGTIGGGGLLNGARQRAIIAAAHAAAAAGADGDGQHEHPLSRSRPAVGVGADVDRALGRDYDGYDRRPPQMPTSATTAAHPEDSDGAPRPVRPWSHANANADPNSHAPSSTRGVGPTQNLATLWPTMAPRSGLLITASLLPPSPGSAKAPSTELSRQSMADDLVFTTSVTRQGEKASSISTGEKVDPQASEPDAPATAVDPRRHATVRWCKYAAGSTIEVALYVVNRHRSTTSTAAADDDADDEDGGGFAADAGSTLIFSWADEAVAKPSGVGYKLLDVEAAKRTYLSNRARFAKGLVPLENHVVMPLSATPGQSNHVTLRLLCLSSGYVKVPDLVVEIVDSDSGSIVAQHRLVDIGHVTVE
ncbi:hypothetical protein ACQY0O_005651 [Thecaphora frezii]